MTPVPALALLVAVAAVGLGSFLWSALVRTVHRRRARRLQRWAGDWGLARAEHCHVRVLRKDAS